MSRPLSLFLLCAMAVAPHCLFGQVTVQPTGQESNPDYVLGPGDQLRIRVVNLEELPDDPITIGLDGAIALPLAGRVPVAGKTSTQVAEDLATRYKEYILRPDISVSVVEYMSQPVSVLGAVRQAGVQQVRGNRTVLEMLSLAGGLTENAGPRLKIARRLDAGRLPLPNAADDTTGQFSVAEISLKSLLEARNPADNILVKPNDVLSVPYADTVYVIGNVLKAGPYAVDSLEKMTALQAVSMAGGMDRMAQPKNARILRKVAGKGERTEIAVNLRQVIDGKQPDITLEPEDILLVPNNAPKAVAWRALDVAIQLGTGVIIWNRY